MTKNEVKKYNRIMEFLADMPDAYVLELHNYWCECNNDMYNRVYDMNELDDLVHGTAMEILNQIDMENFDKDDLYITYNIHGVRSFSYFDEDTSPISIENYALWIVNNNLKIDDDIACILDEFEE